MLEFFVLFIYPLSMTIWAKKLSLEELQQLLSNSPTLLTHLGMEFHEITPNSLSIKMPVDDRTRQPAGFLHGGAAAALAETVASIAAYLALPDPDQFSFGLELNISHLKPVSQGYIISTATPLRIGQTIHVWEIKNTNETGDLVSICRMTAFIRKKT